MATEHQDAAPDLNVPLVPDEKHSKLQDLEAPGNHVDVHTQGATSFFKTCFNGLNALSEEGLIGQKENGKEEWSHGDGSEKSGYRE
ncbi:hypothetical protein POUND7_020362 [Theobroma cacao]